MGEGFDFRGGCCSTSRFVVQGLGLGVEGSRDIFLAMRGRRMRAVGVNVVNKAFRPVRVKRLLLNRFTCRSFKLSRV